MPREFDCLRGSTEAVTTRILWSGHELRRARILVEVGESNSMKLPHKYTYAVNEHSLPDRRVRLIRYLTWRHCNMGVSSHAVVIHIYHAQIRAFCPGSRWKDVK